MAANPAGQRLHVVRIFLGSPGDLAGDREVVRRTVAEYNRTDANLRGFHFQIVGWEDSTKGLGRPQGIINDLIPECHYAIFLLGSRWGSPPSAADSDSVYTSGTEEEYDIALSCIESPDSPMQDVILFFKPIAPKLQANPSEQVAAVIEFKRKLEEEKTAFYWTTESDQRTQELVRLRLGRWLYEAERGSSLNFTEDRSGELAEQRGGVGSPGNAMVDRAWALAADGKLVDAEILFSKLVTERGSEWDFVEYAEFLLRVGRTQQAETILYEVVTSPHSANELARCAALNALGRLKHALGDLNNAERLTQASVVLAKKLGERSAEGSGLTTLGAVEMSRGRLEEADDYYRRALLIKTAVGDSHGVAMLLVNRAVVAQSRGQLAVAERGLLEARQAAVSSGDPILDASILGALALIYMDLGRLGEAEKVLSESLSLEQRSGNKVGIASDLGNMGRLRAMQGDHNAALKYFEQAVTANREIGRLEGVANQLGNIGMELHRTGRLEQAEAAYAEAVDAFIVIGHLDNAARERVRHAYLVFQAGDLSRAVRLLRGLVEVVQGRASAVMRLRLALAHILFDSGKFVESKGELHGIITMCDEHGLIDKARQARELLRMVEEKAGGQEESG